MCLKECVSTGSQACLGGGVNRSRIRYSQTLGSSCRRASRDRTGMLALALKLLRKGTAHQTGQPAQVSHRNGSSAQPGLPCSRALLTGVQAVGAHSTAEQEDLMAQVADGFPGDGSLPSGKTGIAVIWYPTARSTRKRTECWRDEVNPFTSAGTRSGRVHSP